LAGRPVGWSFRRSPEPALEARAFLIARELVSGAGIFVRPAGPPSGAAVPALAMLLHQRRLGLIG
jgi:hypothetical protein